jgi:4-hydroxyphenylpyruvate dioxygenase
MNKRSIATVSLSGTLDEKLRAIASAGFDAVEIFENDLLSFGASPREVAWLCKDLNLEICAFQPSAISRACRSRNARAILPAPSANSI